MDSEHLTAINSFDPLFGEEGERLEIEGADEPSLHGNGAPGMNMMGTQIIGKS